MTTCDELEYGLRDGRIVFISEILPEENGDQCGCICPNCRGTLQARTLGKKRRPYFAHIRDACDTKAARETALHMLAKELLSESRDVLLPEIRFYADELDIPNRLPLNMVTGIPETYVSRAGLWKCDKVEVETPVGDIVPDCIAYVKGHPCMIEFAVTHKVDDIKREKIINTGLPAFEVDLSGCCKPGKTREEIIQAVLYDPTNRYWIYYPQYEQLKEKVKQEYILAFKNFRLKNPGKVYEYEKLQSRLETRKAIEDATIRDSRKAKKAATTQCSKLDVKQEAVNKDGPGNSTADENAQYDLSRFEGAGDYILDTNGEHIVLCETCGKVKLAEKMSYYQYNKGICRECARKMK